MKIRHAGEPAKGGATDEVASTVTSTLTGPSRTADGRSKLRWPACHSTSAAIGVQVAISLSLVPTTRTARGGNLQ